VFWLVPPTLEVLLQLHVANLSQHSNPFFQFYVTIFILRLCISYFLHLGLIGWFGFRPERFGSVSDHLKPKWIVDFSLNKWNLNRDCSHHLPSTVLTEESERHHFNIWSFIDFRKSIFPADIATQFHGRETAVRWGIVIALTWLR